jgi:hypothetical protein
VVLGIVDGKPGRNRWDITKGEAFKIHNQLKKVGKVRSVGRCRYEIVVVKSIGCTCGST